MRKIKARSYNIQLGAKTIIMGILNVTPDSFFDGGKYLNRDKAVVRAREMEREGADIIDIGGQSTRPGAKRVSIQEELDRVMPVVEAVCASIKAPVSIDTYYADVAEAAILKGACIINDITALSGDERMCEVAARHGAAVVLMHMQGAPEKMQKNPRYNNVIGEISRFLKSRISFAEENGIKKDRIIIDPGIGFGKTVRHNLEILNKLGELRKLGKPILAGVSMKSFIGKITLKEKSDRIFGTAGAVAAAIMNGASIVRVHDVGRMKDVALVLDAVVKYKKV